MNDNRLKPREKMALLALAMCGAYEGMQDDLIGVGGNAVSGKAIATILDWAWGTGQRRLMVKLEEKGLVRIIPAYRQKWYMLTSWGVDHLAWRCADAINLHSLSLQNLNVFWAEQREDVKNASVEL